MSLLDRYIVKMRLYAEKIPTRSLCHNSVPVWRSRAFSAAKYLCRNTDKLDLDQLTIIDKLLDQFIYSFNSSTVGFYSAWCDMKAEIQERIECLQEEDEKESLEIIEETEGDTGGVHVLGDKRNIPGCIPVNCKFCTHHGYLAADTFKNNVFTHAYLCENPKAERYGLLMASSPACRHMVDPHASAPRDEGPCRHTSTSMMDKVCRHRRAYIYGSREKEKEQIPTGLFTCYNPKSDHCDHVFTKTHRMCHWWD